MVAIALLALLIVTTLTLFAQLLASTTKSGYLDVANLYADQLLEQISSNPNSSSPAFPALRTGEKEFLVQGDQSPTKFVYRIDATQIDAGTSVGERWFVEVEVRWWTDDTESTETARAGYGELRTVQNRMVYAKW
jgi:hypothetical protein